MFLNLASDSSKLVRTGALQHLGRLISTLPGDSVSEDLVRYFTGTAVESMGDPVVSWLSYLVCPIWCFILFLHFIFSRLLHWRFTGVMGSCVHCPCGGGCRARTVCVTRCAE